ncbi:MAG: phage tail sheath protein [Bacilli bacterium]
MQNYNLPGVNIALEDGGLIIPEVLTSEAVLVIAPSLSQDAPTEPVLIRNEADLLASGLGGFYVGGQINPIAAKWKALKETGVNNAFLCALKQIPKSKAQELEDIAIAEMTKEGASPDEIAAVAGTLVGDTRAHIARRQFLYLHELLIGTLADFPAAHVVLAGVEAEEEVTEMNKYFFQEIENYDQFPNIGGFVKTAHVIRTQNLFYPLEIKTGTNDVIKLKTVENGVEVERTVTLTAAEYDGNEARFEDLVKDLERALKEAKTDAPAPLAADGEDAKKARTARTATVNPIHAIVKENDGAIEIFFEQEVEVAEGTTMEAVRGKKSEYKRTEHGMIIKGHFTHLLGYFCEMRTLSEQATLGYIGTKKPADTKVSTLRTHVENLLKLDTEVSPYVQIVPMEVAVTIPNTGAQIFVGGAVAYAGLVATLNIASATTNKPLKGISGLRYQLSLRQLANLTAKKMVVFRVKEGRAVVVDGITTAPFIHIGGRQFDSDFARLSTLRITQTTIQEVRRAAEPFIGEINEMPKYNALNTAIESALRRLLEQNVLQGYKFTVVAANERLDKANVRLQLVPAFELRNIDAVASLRPPTFLGQ